MFNVFQTAWLFLKCLWLQLQVRRSRGWGRCWPYPWLAGVPGRSRRRHTFTCYQLWKGNLALANLPSVFKVLGALVVSCPEASLETPPLSFVAHFWKSKTRVSQSREAHCWEVGIVPLIALRRKREGRWLQYVVVDFVLKSVAFFHGGGGSIVKQGNEGFRCFGTLEILFCAISLVQLVFVLGVILMLHNWEKIRTAKSCVKSRIQKKTEPTCFSWKSARCW